jgi:hypothetical protein
MLLTRITARYGFRRSLSSQRLNLILVDYEIGRIRVGPGRGAKGLPMRAIVAICVAIATLWLADIELNDGHYSDATGRTIVGLVEK